MKTMFAVSTGSYDDYSVVCLCETKEEAEAVLKKVGEDRPDDSGIEEFVVLKPDVEKINVLRLGVYISKKNGLYNFTSNNYEVWPTDVDDCYPATWSWFRDSMLNDCSGRLIVSGYDHGIVGRVYAEKCKEYSEGTAIQGDASGRVTE